MIINLKLNYKSFKYTFIYRTNVTTTNLLTMSSYTNPLTMSSYMVSELKFLHVSELNSL